MIPLPSGTVTFLFTDIEGSTRRWEEHPQVMQAAVARHDALLRRAIEAHGGAVFKTVGDAFCAAFSTAAGALLAALDAQRALVDEPWDSSCAICVRMALHTGAAEERNDDYFGPAVNRVARLLGAAHGGQILLSGVTRALVQDDLPAGVELRDLGEHRLRDLTRIEHVYQVVAGDLPADFPPLKVLDIRPTNLPAHPTAFVGRVRDVEDVCGIVQRDDVGLLVLTGPGGTGKTRLAMRVGETLLHAFRDGVFFVSLAPVTDPALVASTVVHTLGVETRGNQPLIDTLAEHLREKEMLLILDNFEQVLEAATVVETLLERCLHLKILVTSRAVLHLYGEHDFPVPPLAIPDPDRLPDLDTLSQYDAVALFIQRALAVKPSFQVTNENAPAVAQICHRLDGLPLAIELAAARIRILSPQAILSRLSSRLALLTGGAGNLPARQQTLRGAIEWSYSLLSPEEQMLFARLGVFVGGFMLEAIDALSAGDADFQMDALDGVASLVDKSLLRQSEGSGDRFLMLETIREYALEVLRARGEIDATRRRHAAYCLELAEAGEKGMLGPDQLHWADRIENEHDNLRAAMGFALETGDAETCLRIAGALTWLFWYIRGYRQEGRTWLERALVLPGAADSPRAQAKALLGAGTLAFLVSDFAVARARIDESLTLGRQVSDRWTVGRALLFQSWVSAAEGDTRAARSPLEQSLAMAREEGDRWEIADRLHSLGALLMYLQEYDTARSMLEESVAIWRELGQGGKYNVLIAYPLNSLGDLARLQGDYRQAAAYYEESLEVFNQVGSRGDRASVLSNLGHVAAAQGDDRRAVEHFRAALLMFRQVGDRRGLAECLAGLAGAYAATDPGRAALLFGATDRLLHDLGAQLWPSNHEVYERGLTAARAGLPQVLFQAAWDRGHAMTAEQAVASLQEIPAREGAPQAG